MADGQPQGDASGRDAVALIGWRENGVIVAANQLAADFLGLARDALLARSYWDLSDPDHHERELQAARELQPYTKDFRHGDGHSVGARVVGVTALGDDTRLCAFVPTVDRWQSQREVVLRRQNQLLLRLAQSDAIDDGDLARALPLLTEVAADGLECERASIWLYTGDKSAIECLDLYRRSQTAHAAGGILHARDFPAYFRALAEARTIAAADAHTDPATREFSAVYLTPNGIGAMLEAPIRRRGKLVGVLCNEHVGPAREFSRDEQSYAASVAETVARALDAADRRRVEEGLADAKSELEALDLENRALIDQLRRSVALLSSPVLEVWSDVLALPVIGALDDERSAQMTEHLLAELTRTRARHVIIDLTGLDGCDTSTALALGHMARAVRLIGAECVLSGVRPQVAQAFVDLDLDLRGLRIQRNMSQALRDIVARHAARPHSLGQ